MEGDLDLMLELKKSFRLLSKYKLIVLAMACLFGTGGFFYAKFSEPTFRSELLFSIKSDMNGTFASISNLSNLLGGGSNPSGSPLERTVEVIKSETLLINVLFTTTVVKNKSDLFINHFLDVYHFRSKWEASNDTAINQLKNIRFKPYSKFENLNFQEKKVLKIILNKIVGKSESLLQPSFDKKSGIITLAFNSVHEELAINFTTSLYQELVKFYQFENNANSSKNLFVLEKKVDSLRNLLYQTQLKSAEINDQALGLVLQKDRVDAKSNSVKENMLMIAYGEAQKNLETLRFMNSSSKTLFTILQYPFSPIKPIVKSKILFTLVGLILGFLISFFLLRIRLFFHESYFWK
ncbi:Wzz/FepE/Etk N-terminal domain-containing protein [Aquirufa sp. ROCK-SH2]